MKRAMIFCAGFGTRMKFLSEILPKPLLPVLNIALLDYILFQLQKLGFKDVVINLHHLSDLIKKNVQSRKWNMNIEFSQENEILGTGGGLKKVEYFFKNEKKFLVINSDCLCDFQLNEALVKHDESAVSATMFVQKKLSGYSGITLSSTSIIESFDDGTFMFCGIHILDQSIFSYLDSKPSCIIQTGYKRMLRDNKMTFGYEFKNPWYDFGTLELYRHHQFKLLSELSQEKIILEAQKYFFSNLQEIEENIWCQGSITKNNNVLLKSPCLLGDKVYLDDDTEIGPFTIVGEKCRIGKGSHLNHSILFPKIKVKDRDLIRDQIIC